MVSRPKASVELTSLGAMYGQVVAWMNDSSALAQSRDPFSDAQLRQIEDFCLHLLLRNEGRASYSFGWRELTEHLSEQLVKQLEASRFLCRESASLDQYSFVHASFQEYFAAVAMTRLDDEQFNQLFNRAFVSEERFYILRFLAGIESRPGEPTVACCVGFRNKTGFTECF